MAIESAARVLTGPNFTIPIVRVVGPAYERGRQRGEQIPQMIRRRVESMNEGYRRIAPRPRLLQLADEAEAVLREKVPSAVAELRGISDSTGIGWDELRIAALVRTVGFQAVMGSEIVRQDDCLCIVASGPATADGDIIVGKNGDFLTSVSAVDDLFITEVVPDRGYAHVAVGVYPEKPTQPEGMNERGVAVVGAGQYPKDGLRAFETGTPTGACIYHVLQRVYTEAATVDEAIAILADAPRGYTGRVMLIGDATGAWAKVEITYEHMSVKRPDADARYRTNHIGAGTSGVFSDPAMQSLITDRRERPAAYARYDLMMELLVANAGRIDAALAQDLLRDHTSGPGLSSPCKHIDGVRAEDVPPLEALPTLEALLFEPARLRGWIAKGAPCSTSFVPFTVPTRSMG